MTGTTAAANSTAILPAGGRTGPAGRRSPPAFRSRAASPGVGRAFQGVGCDCEPILRAAAATAAFGVIHSALASDAAKAAAERVLGTRVRNGLYRPLYNVIALATFGGLTGHLLRLAARPLYRVRGPAAGVVRLGQFACLAYACHAAREVGIARFAGLPGLLALLAGRERVPREPEAQGPPLDRRTGGIRAAGPFASSRQPLNFVLVPLLWLNPRMTSTRAAFSAVSTLYLYLGALHSERRLRRAYGAAYEAYRRSGVPFFLPSLRRRRRAPKPRPPAVAAECR